MLDEADVVIGDALNAYLGTNIIAATMSDSLREYIITNNRIKE